MKVFNRIYAAVSVIMIVIFVSANVILLTDKAESGRPYLVEISRLVSKIESDG